MYTAEKSDIYKLFHFSFIIKFERVCNYQTERRKGLDGRSDIFKKCILVSEIFFPCFRFSSLSKDCDYNAYLLQKKNEEVFREIDGNG